MMQNKFHSFLWQFSKAITPKRCKVKIKIFILEKKTQTIFVPYVSKSKLKLNPKFLSTYCFGLRNLSHPLHFVKYGNKFLGKVKQKEKYQKRKCNGALN